MAIAWSDTYATGLGWQDNEHKELFLRINALVQSMGEGKGKIEVSNTVNFLGSYVVEHFGKEEAAMGEHSYPEIEAHKEEHKNFKDEFIKFQTDLAEDKSSLLAIEVQEWLGNWLKTHILKIDRDLGSYLVEKES